MPAAVADPKQSLDSEQTSPATIAHHTVYEKIPNLHQSHMCQSGAQPYLVGPLSRLVGKPSFSPWLSRKILPLKKAANDPNSTISLTQTFDRISLRVCNSLYFGVQKAKNGDRGTFVFTATLTGPLFPIGIEHLIYMKFFCYGSSYGYQGHINIGSSAPDSPGTVQKHSDTSTTLKKEVDRLVGTRKP